jgi:hypothetical protein
MTSKPDAAEGARSVFNPLLTEIQRSVERLLLTIE